MGGGLHQGPFYYKRKRPERGPEHPPPFATRTECTALRCGHSGGNRRCGRRLSSRISSSVQCPPRRQGRQAGPRTPSASSQADPGALTEGQTQKDLRVREDIQVGADPTPGVLGVPTVTHILTPHSHHGPAPMGLAYTRPVRLLGP